MTEILSLSLLLKHSSFDISLFKMRFLNPFLNRENHRDGTRIKINPDPISPELIFHRQTLL